MCRRSVGGGWWDYVKNSGFDRLQIPDFPLERFELSLLTRRSFWETRRNTVHVAWQWPIQEGPMEAKGGICMRNPDKTCSSKERPVGAVEVLGSKADYTGGESVSLWMRLKGAVRGCFCGPCMGSVGLAFCCAELVSGEDINGFEASHRWKICETSNYCLFGSSMVAGYCCGCFVGPCWCCYEGFKNPDHVGVDTGAVWSDVQACICNL